MNKRQVEFLGKVLGYFQADSKARAFLGVKKLSVLKLFENTIAGYNSLNERDKIIQARSFLDQVKSEVGVQLPPPPTLEGVEFLKYLNDFQTFSETVEPHALTPNQAATGQGFNIKLGSILDKNPNPLASALGNKIVSSAAAKVGVGKLATGLLAKAAGVLTGPVGALLATVGPNAVSWVQRNFKNILKYGGGLLLAGGVVTGSAVVAGAGALGALGGFALETGSISAGMSGLASGIGAFFAGLGGAVLGAIAIPLVVSLIAIPVIIVIILFIINSGAYLVPPAKVTSPYGPPGEAAKELCLPASGGIIQLPFCETGINFTHCKSQLNAYDIGNRINTPIFAVHNGLARSIADDPSETNRDQGYGNNIRISGEGMVTIYGHMIPNEIIPPGTSKEVQKGDLIGYMGSTGRSRSPHVHFELVSPREHIQTRFGAAELGQQVQNCFGK